MQQSQAVDEQVTGTIREFERLQSDRSMLDSLCEEIAARFIPMHVGSFTSRGQTNKNAKNTEEFYDSTGAIALNRFAAIVESLLTPANQTWHRVAVNDESLMRSRRVKLYFEEVTRTLFRYRYAPAANFTAQNQQGNKGLGAYGTRCMFIDRLQSEPGFRYRNIHLGEAYFAENHQGVVDKVFRNFPLTARQAIQKWGDRVPKEIQDRAKSNPEQEFFFIHCVKPRESYDPQKRDFRGMPWSSEYISLTGKALLSEHGYNSFPYAVSRHEQGNGEVYGRSPAMEVLPAMKTLNEEKKTVLIHGHRAIAPILLAHDDGIVDQFSWRHGAINPGGVSKDGQMLVHAVPTGNIAIGKELMDDEREVIKDAFFVTLFQLLIDGPQKSATEVMELAREKGMLIAPVLGRQQSETYGPQIEREIDLGAEQRLLPPMPPELKEAKGQYKIIYDSPLSRMQRSEEAAGLMRTLETALRISEVTQNPEVLDYFDFDVIMPDLADIQGMPERWKKSLEKVQTIRQGRAEQQRTQTEIQAGPSIAAVTKAAAAVRKA